MHCEASLVNLCAKLSSIAHLKPTLVEHTVSHLLQSNSQEFMKSLRRAALEIKHSNVPETMSTRYTPIWLGTVEDFNFYLAVDAPQRTLYIFQGPTSQWRCTTHRRTSLVLGPNDQSFQVHHSVQHLVNSIWERCLGRVHQLRTRWRADAANPIHVVFTGGSYGGAAAQILAAVLMLRDPLWQLRTKTSIVCFESTPPGDAAFCRVLHGLCETKGSMIDYCNLGTKEDERKKIISQGFVHGCPQRIVKPVLAVSEKSTKRVLSKYSIGSSSGLLFGLLSETLEDNTTVCYYPLKQLF